MRILLINSLGKAGPLEGALAHVARENGWRLTVVRPSSRRVLALTCLLFGTLGLSLLAAGFWAAQFVPWTLWISLAAVLVATTAAYALYKAARRALVRWQLHTGRHNVRKAVVSRMPNMVVALGYGCALALEHEALRQLPGVYVSPAFTPEEEATASLSDTPFAFITYDTAQPPDVLKESLLLADTAEPGACTTEWLSLRVVGENKLRSMLAFAFARGWRTIIAREGCHVEMDAEGTVRLHIDNTLAAKYFFQSTLSGTSQTEWLAQDDLATIITTDDDQPVTDYV